MIDHNQLTDLANGLGIASVLLVVAFHFVAINRTGLTTSNKTGVAVEKR